MSILAIFRDAPGSFNLRMATQNRSGRHHSPVARPLIFVAILIAACIGLFAWKLHWPWWAGYLLGINLATFVIWGYDKKIAGGTHTRIPERLLHALAFCGGSPAALLAQRAWHHKTIKQSFRIRLAMIVVVQIIIAVALIIRWRHGAL